MSNRVGSLSLRTAKSTSDHLRVLTTIIVGVALCGLVLAVIATLLGGFVDGFFYRSLCFQRSCLSRAFFLFKAPVVIASGTLAFLSAVATIGGIFVALQSYVASTRATAFTNHIAQLNAFIVYVSGEIAKRPRVSAQSVDIFFWYRMIFEHAGSGDLAVSDRYEKIIYGINDAIRKSNGLATEASRERFKYVDHQTRMILELKKFGISLVRQPRLEFFEVEDQVVSMIRAVNFAFCPGSGLPDVADRAYL